MPSAGEYTRSCLREGPREFELDEAGLFGLFAWAGCPLAVFEGDGSSQSASDLWPSTIARHLEPGFDIALNFGSYLECLGIVLEI